MGLRNIKKKMDALEAERQNLRSRNEDTEFIDEAIRDLEEFMQSAIDEYEAMDIDKKGDTGTEEKGTGMDINDKTGEKRDRSATADPSSTGDGLRAFANATGKSFKGFLKKT